ncbi:helix-turn-helix domain-containing protein [Nocardioides sp. MAHUQ-72]|uniref:helix-turn-helix domain-containing protein n=1 Tax=unclassified Nocardioides TaxID=2615069 RepID=UPI003619B7F3
MPDDYLGVTEAAALAGVNAQSIRDWIAKGRLAAYRRPIGGPYLIKRIDLLAAASLVVVEPKGDR